MKNVKAPRTNVSRSACSIPALLLLGALSGTALAATDIQEPCHKADAGQDVLTAFVAEDAAAPLIRTVDTAESAPAAATDADEKTAPDAEESEAATASDSSAPALTTRLPGVSASDMPGFRRHMYRTDI